MRLVIEASVEKLDEVLEFVDSYLEKLDCPMEIMTLIDISVEEIFVNIAHYAYTPNKGEADISIENVGQDIEITFKDYGVPFNPLARPDPDVTLPAEDRQIGGLGIYIVKDNMDRVVYEYKENQNIFKLIKRIK